MHLLQTYFNSEKSASLKDWLPLISVVLTLGIFIYDRLLAVRIRRVEVERNWYLKVLIEPNLDKISQFYISIEKIFNEAVETLNASKEIPHKEYTIAKRQQNEKFIDEKRSLQASLIFPLQPRYPLLSSKIDELFIDLYDEFTGRLDKEAFTDEDSKEFYVKTQSNKSKLLNLLYLPLSKNTPKEIRRQIERIS